MRRFVLQPVRLARAAHTALPVPVPFPTEPPTPTPDDYHGPNLKGLEKRFPAMDTAARNATIDYLNHQQAAGWQYLSPTDKRALYYLLYGPWGPRDPAPQRSIGDLLLQGVGLLVVLSLMAVAGYNYQKDKHNSK